MSRKARLALRVACLLSLFAWISHAQAQTSIQPQSAGQVVVVTGPAWATRAVDRRVTLVTSDPVYAGDHLSTAENTWMQLRLNDAGRLLLKPDSEFDLLRQGPAPGREGNDNGNGAPQAAASPPAADIPAAVNADPAANRSVWSLLSGGLRSISGSFAHQDPDKGFELDTPVATIGIRGTEYLLLVCDAACAADPQLTAALPAGASARQGVIAHVIKGSIEVRSTVSAATESLAPAETVIALTDGRIIRLTILPVAAKSLANPGAWSYAPVSAGTNLPFNAGWAPAALAIGLAIEAAGQGSDSSSVTGPTTTVNAPPVAE